MPTASRRRRAVLVAVALVSGILGGLTGVRLAGPDVAETDLGSVRSRVALSTADRAGLEVYVPLADWGLRARIFGAPVRIELEPRAPDRAAVNAAVTGDQSLLRRTRGQVDAVMRSALARAALWALVGALIGGLLALIVWERLGVRGRGLLLAPAIATAAVALLVGVGAAWAALTYEPGRIERPRYFASGEELHQLLAQADDLRRSGRRYRSQAEGALSAILALTRADAVPTAARRRAVLASDLHANALAIPVLRRYSSEVPLFMPGDFAVNGFRVEAALLKRVETAGRPVVMTSGNHDAEALMREFARDGAIVLTHAGRLQPDGGVAGPPVVRVGGLTVAGFEDPLQYPGPDYPSGIRTALSFTDMENGDERFREEADRYWDWWNELPERPAVLLVHQAALARDLAQRIAQADPDGPPLAILAGHTHRQRVDINGPVTVVDSGSVGAGGPFGAGKDDIGLAVLHFTERPAELEVADLASIDPRDGSAQAQRVVMDSPDCGERLVRCEGAPAPG